MKKIGLFGGTFDPIHCGHLNLAFELMEVRGLDEVWFIPARVNPFKLEMEQTSFNHRVSMLQLAIAGIPSFVLKNIEKNLPLPSYTIHTLKAILAEASFISYPPPQFYLMLGEDAIPGFSNWYLVEEIVKLVPLLIASRPGNKVVSFDMCSSSIKEAIEKGLTETRMMDVSSTMIRDRLKKSLYCGHLLHASVLKYMNENHLYPSN